MPMNIDIDTTDLVRVERPLPRVAPPLDAPDKPIYYRGPMPTTAIVNPDAIRNFQTPQIPSYRILPPQPLNLAGAGVNATPIVSTVPVLVQQPPAPTIAQTLTSIPTGYQFSFNQVRLPMGSAQTISTYKVYRSSTSDISSGVMFHTFPHNPATLGVPVAVQDAQPNGVTQFYWVSAVNVSGVESSLTPAQSAAVANTAGFNSSSRLASSFNNTAVNVAFAPTSSTTLSNAGAGTTVVVSAHTNQFAPGGLAYNSGSVDPGSFGTSYVYCDDPTFQGGAVAYQVTFSGPFQQVGSEGRLPIGKIATALGSTKTGGGYTGGTTGAGAGGGRGYIE